MHIVILERKPCQDNEGKTDTLNVMGNSLIKEIAILLCKGWTITQPKPTAIC